jgi:hypothetical protein
MGYQHGLQARASFHILSLSIVTIHVCYVCSECGPADKSSSRGALGRTIERLFPRVNLNPRVGRASQRLRRRLFAPCKPTGRRPGQAKNYRIKKRVGGATSFPRRPARPTAASFSGTRISKSRAKRTLIVGLKPRAGKPRYDRGLAPVASMLSPKVIAGQRLTQRLPVQVLERRLQATATEGDAAHLGCPRARLGRRNVGNMWY